MPKFNKKKAYISEYTNNNYTQHFCIIWTTHKCVLIFINDKTNLTLRWINFYNVVKMQKLPFVSTIINNIQKLLSILTFSIKKSVTFTNKQHSKYVSGTSRTSQAN